VPARSVFCTLTAAAAAAAGAPTTGFAVVLLPAGDDLRSERRDYC
jgi:hypothetical protein